MNVTSFSARNLPTLLISIASLFSSAAHAQYFTDTFEDGSATDGSPVTWVVDPPFVGGTHVVQDGSYVLTPDETRDTTRNYSELDLSVEGREFEVVSLRTSARLLRLESSVLLGVAGRITSNLAGSQNTGVWGALRTSGRISLGVFNVAENKSQTWEAFYGPFTSSLIANDVNLQLDIFADAAALTAWDVGTPRPAQPQLLLTDLPDYVPAQGRVGLWTGHDITPPMSPVAFRYFEAAPIPEPSAALLVGLAAAPLLIVARRQRIATCILLLGTLAGSWAAQIAHAAHVLIDDFNDGDDQGWTHRDYTTPASGGPANYSPVEGAYRLNGTSSVPKGDVGVMLSTWDQSAAPHFQHGYLRARVRVNSNSLGYLVLRHQPNSRSFYLFGIDPSGEPPVFFYNRIEDFRVSGSGGFDIPGEKVEIGEEWMIQAGAVGNRLSMKVWKPSDPEPAAPQWTRLDTRFSSGIFGVGASHWAEQPPSVVSATFDDVSFLAVPEPAAWASLLLGFGVVLRTCQRTGRQGRAGTGAPSRRAWPAAQR